MVILSLTGLLRTLLIMVGVFMVLRFIGQLMIAKRNLSEQEILDSNRKKAQKDVHEAQRNFGKTTISKVSKRNFKEDDFTDYEEIS